MKRNKRNKYVTLWDESSNTFARIPQAELAPGMVPCHLPGRKEVVWRDAASVDPGNSPYRHPPFGAEMRSLIESVVDAFPGMLKWSYEEWEDLLRKDTNPHLEIRYWLVAARVFRQFAEGRPFAYRQELFRLLTVCNVTPREFLPMVIRRKLLSVDEVEAIADLYYSHFAG
jgi:hypothetical protein